MLLKGWKKDIFMNLVCRLKFGDFDYDNFLKFIFKLLSLIFKVLFLIFKLSVLLSVLGFSIRVNLKY